MTVTRTLSAGLAALSLAAGLGAVPGVAAAMPLTRITGPQGVTLASDREVHHHHRHLSARRHGPYQRYGYAYDRDNGGIDPRGPAYGGPAYGNGAAGASYGATQGIDTYGYPVNSPLRPYGSETAITAPPGTAAAAEQMNQRRYFCNWAPERCP